MLSSVIYSEISACLGNKVHGGEAGRWCRWNGSTTVETLLPPDFNGTTAGKHARVDGSTWHTASFYPSWEVNIDRHNDNCLPVVYKMSSRTISSMSKMCVSREIFVIWAPLSMMGVAATNYDVLVLNCKINTTSLPSRGTSMKTAYRRLCIAIFAILYVRRYTYLWHVF